MAKTRMYRKKGRKTMRRGGARKTRRIRRRGGNINDELYKNFTDPSQLGAR